MSDVSEEPLPETEHEELELLPERPVVAPSAQLLELAQIQTLQNVRSAVGDVAILAETIRVRGLLHPVVVRPAQDASHGKPYELVVGYRRLQAFRELERDQIPAIVHAANDEELLAEMVSENLQREDHSPLDEARTMQRMIETFDWSHAQVAKQLGVDRSQVTKRLGLLRLPEQVQTMVAEGQLTASHAEVVARLDREESQIELAELAVKKETPVSKLNSYASAIKERDDEQISADDPEAAPEDPHAPLDELTDDQVVDLPAMQVAAKLSGEQLDRANLYILLRAANDEEMLDVLQHEWGVAFSELWLWVTRLSHEQVLEMRETMIRRWLGAAHRFPTLPADLVDELGAGSSSWSARSAPQPPADTQLAEPEDWDDDLDDWGDEFDDGTD